MYYRGEGVSVNFGEAIKWFRLAADQGNAAARVWLGHIYYTGEGVPQDFQEAVNWFRLAADQRNAASQFLLDACTTMEKEFPRISRGSKMVSTGR